MLRPVLEIDEGAFVYVPAGCLVQRGGVRTLAPRGVFHEVVAVEWIDPDEPRGWRGFTVRLGFADGSWAAYEATDRVTVEERRASVG